MKPRDILGIAIRLLGLVFLGRALWLAPDAIDELFRGIVQLDAYRMFAGLWIVGWPFLASIWLLRGAPPLLQLAYPDASNRGGTKSETQDGK